MYVVAQDKPYYNYNNLNSLLFSTFIHTLTLINN